MARHDRSDPSRSPTSATLAEPVVPLDEGFARIGEILRRLALGMTAILLVIRPYWPSEDASTGTGLTWVCATLVVLAVAIIAALFAGTFRYRFSRVDAAFLLLVLLVGLSATGASDRRAAINLAWEWAGIAVMFVLVRNLPRTRGESVGLAGVIAATAVAIAAYGLYQGFVELPSLQKLVRANPEATMRLLGVTPGSPGEVMMRHRILDSKEPFSTFALANSLAGFLVGPLVLGLAVVVDNLRRAGQGSRVVAIGLANIPTALVILCLLLTKSRSAYVGLAVAVLMIAIRSWRHLSVRTLIIAGGVLVVTLVGFVAGLASIGQLDRQVWAESAKSLRYRWEYWQATWGIITNAPIPFEPKGAGLFAIGEEVPTTWPESRAFWRGLGPGNFAGPYLRHKRPESSEEIVDPHNMVLDVWCIAGLPAVALLLGALGMGLWQAFRPGRAPTDDPEFTTSTTIKKRRPDHPPPTSTWVLGWGAAGWIVVVALGKLNPFEGDQFIRWLVLGLGWISGAGLGSLLWRRRPLSADAAGVAVLAMALNLLAAGGVGMPAVALPFWIFLALALNLRDDLACGTLNERAGLMIPSLTALGWAGLVGTFAGAIGPFWISENFRTQGEQAMKGRLPAYEIAEAAFMRAIEADKANVLPLLDLAELKYRFSRSPEARNRSVVWEEVFLTLDSALKSPWRDPNSLHIRRLQAEYGRLLFRSLDKPTARDALSLQTKIARATRWIARLYPTSAAGRAQLAFATADMGFHADAVAEAGQALQLHAITPHSDKKLPDATVRELQSKIPEWITLRDNPPKPPTK